MGDMKNERGTTLISILLTLLIIGITMPLLIHFLTYIHVTDTDQDMPIEHFFIFLRNDTLMATDVYADENDIVYFQLSTGEVARIEQYKNMIRRRVDGKGHEIYLRDIETFQVESLPYGIRVTIINEEGETYEKSIAFYE